MTGRAGRPFRWPVSWCFGPLTRRYTILTVLFALVLFFAAASTRLGRTRAQWIVLGAAIVFLLAATVILATFPIDL